MIFDRLLGRRAKEKKIENLVLCVLKHDRVAVENLLRQKVDPNGVWKENAQKKGDGEEMTPLAAATSFPKDGSVEMVNLLIKYGAEVNTVIYMGETLISPLFNCVLQHRHNPKSLEVYWALRDAGADMFCAPVRPPFVAHEKMKRWGEGDYGVMDDSINDLLDGLKLRKEWEQMENEYLTRRQKKMLTNITDDVASLRPRRSSKL